MSTFVSVGNAHQPFTRLLAAVAAVANQLPQPVIVQHGHTPFPGSACQVVPFLEMSRFVQMIVAADLVILQAGGGAVIQAIQAGKTPVIVPRRAEHGEHVDNHQVSWGRTFASTGRVVLVEDLGGLVLAAHQALERQAQSRVELVSQPLLVSTIGEILAQYAASERFGRNAR